MFTRTRQKFSVLRTFPTVLNITLTFKFGAYVPKKNPADSAIIYARTQARVLLQIPYQQTLEHSQQDRQSMYNITLWRVCDTSQKFGSERDTNIKFVAIERQKYVVFSTAVTEHKTCNVV